MEKMENEINYLIRSIYIFLNILKHNYTFLNERRSKVMWVVIVALR